MPDRTNLMLLLHDVYDKPLGEQVDLLFLNQTLSERLVVRAVSASGPISVAGLITGANSLYQVECDPPSYLPVKFFVRVRPDASATFVFAIDPKKVVRVDFPAFTALDSTGRALLEASSLGSVQGAALYDGLDDLRRAGLLNIFAKAVQTRIADGLTALSGLTRLMEIRQDRIFAACTAELFEETASSVAGGLFRRVGSVLHQRPAGFEGAGSFKTDDHYGNLQITFWRRENEFLVDMDIDDAGGLEHLFQIVRNAISGRPTHPFDIHQILIRWQAIDPGYRFVLREG